MDNDIISVEKSLEEKEEKGKIDEKKGKKNGDTCSIDMCIKEKKTAKIIGTIVFSTHIGLIIKVRSSNHSLLIIRI